MRMVSAFAAAAILAAGTAPALASPPSKPCTSAEQASWMKMDDAKSMLVKDGYSVRRMKVAMNCYEAYVVKDGKRLELFLDPVSGKVVETREN